MNKKRIKYQLASLLCSIVVCGLVAVPANAGSINGAEQRALSTAAQPFTYQGETYVVSSSYLGSARAKLAKDGVDMTDSQASGYISKFHSSQPELVAKGYAVRRSDGKQADAATKKSAAEKHASSTQKENEAFLSTALGEPKQDTKKDSKKNSSKKNQTDREEKKNSSGKNSEHASEEGNQNATTEKTSVATPVPTADSEWLSNNKGELLTVDNNDLQMALNQSMIATKSGKKIIAVEKKVEKDDFNLFQKFSILKIGAIVFSVLSVITLLGMIYYITKIRRKHHNRPFQYILATMGGITIAGWLILIMLSFSMRYGLISTKSIERQMMESQYFTGVTLASQQVAKKSFKAAGYDTNIAENVIDLSTVYDSEKTYVHNILLGNTVKPKVAVLEKKLSENIPEKDSVKKNQIISEISKSYQEIISFRMGEIISNIRQEYSKWTLFSVIMGIVSLIFIVPCMTKVCRHRYQGGIVVSVSNAMTVLFMVVFSGVLMAKYKIGSISVTPIYYEVFIEKMISWNVKVLFCFTTVSFVLLIMSVIWTKHLHKISRG